MKISHRHVSSPLIKRIAAMASAAFLTAASTLALHAQGPQPVSLEHRNYVPLSPSAAALHDAVNFPVEGNAGAADISIPLYTVEYGKIRIPITLRYSTAAAKVDGTTAPNAGFGWVLDVGGSVNRVVKGKPDEASVWYSGSYFNQARLSDDQFTLSSIYGWYGTNKYDTEHDEFVMNTPSGSASFYVTPASSPQGSFEGHFSPSVNWKIKRTVLASNAGTMMFNGIDILDADGTEYRFGTASSSSLLPPADTVPVEYGFYSADPVGTFNVSTGWNLREVVDDAGRKVSLSWVHSGTPVSNRSHDQWYKMTDKPQLFWTEGSAPSAELAHDYLSTYYPDWENSEQSFDAVAFSPLLPKKISWPQGSVEFTVSGNLVTGFTVREADGTLLRSVSFSTSANDIKPSAPLLSYVRVYDAAGALRQTYTMDYNSTASSSVSNPGCDWWGYFNGAQSYPARFLPYRSFTVEGYQYSTTASLGNGGNRTPSAYAIQHHILKSITYPSGGSAHFVFEPNTYCRERGTTVTQGTGAGLRIKSITLKDKSSTVTLKKTYSYTGGSVNILPNDSRYEGNTIYRMYIYEQSVGYGPASPMYAVSDRVRMVSPRYNPDVAEGGDAVAYDSVTETVCDPASGTALGSTRLTFSVPSNVSIGTTGILNATDAMGLDITRYHLQGESLSYNTSRLERKEEYNAQGQLARRTTYHYREQAAETLSNLRVLHLVHYCYPRAEAQYDSRLMKDYLCTRMFFQDGGADSPAPLYYYRYNSTRGVRYPAGETVETFSTDSSGDASTDSVSTSRTVSYDLSQAYHLPLSVSETRSDGSSLVTAFTYPFHHGGDSVADTMTARHILSPVFTQTRTLSSGGSSSTLDSYKVCYGIFSNVCRPASVQYALGSNPFETRISYEAYDLAGNPRSLLYGNGTREAYLWGCSHQVPVVKTSGLSWNELRSALGNRLILQIEGSAAPTAAQISEALSLIRASTGAQAGGLTFRPLYGVTLTQDAKGVETRFSFDAFQRLSDKKHGDGSLLEHTDYADSQAEGGSWVKTSRPDTALSHISSVPLSKRRTEATYFDGLYRQRQKVSAFSTPDGKDAVTESVYYDAYGRLSDKGLPFATSVTSTSTGMASFVASDNALREDWYSSLYSQQDATLASQRLSYENSPVGRVLREYLPGAGAYASTACTRHDHGTNGASQVHVWTASATTGVATRGGFYPAGSLSKETVTDPDGRVAVTFTDRQGNVVERWDEGTPETGANDGFLRTSFVHDPLGKLLAVIPPKGQPASQAASSPASPDSYFRYVYDHRGRLAEAFLPEKGLTEYVYDADDRLVASRDARHLASGLWHFFRYDRYGRQVYEGTVSSSASAASLRTAYRNASFNETRSTSASSLCGYTASDSVLPVQENDLLKLTYYDSYGFPSQKAFVPAGPQLGQDSGFSPADGTGKVTGTRTKALDSNELTASATWLTTTFYYNDRGETVQAVSDIWTGGASSPMGTRRLSTLRRQQGETAATREDQTVAGTTVSLLRLFSYDSAGRLSSIRQSIDGGALETIETDTYDAIGRLSSRTFGQNVQKADYSYDIRSRLTAINDPASLSDDKFAMRLAYETTDLVSGSTPRYSGAISAVLWKHAGEQPQTFLYSYDNFGRLSSGFHSGGNGESISYDDAGNILSLSRTGSQAATLSFTYPSGRSSFSAVTHNGTVKNYAYNTAGDITSDGLRGTAMAYNNNGSLKSISSGTDSMTYVNDADGGKLSTTLNGTLLNIYCGDFVYGPTLTVDHIRTPNGQMTRNATSGTYSAQYSLTDHLGSTRCVVNQSGTVLQKTDYYPYGLPFTVANVQNNRYLYNGKELEHQTLGQSYLGTLDYGARHYDPLIARWHSTDPLQQKYLDISPYAYCAGDPVNLVDVDGRDVRVYVSAQSVGTTNIYLYNSKERKNRIQGEIIKTVPVFCVDVSNDSGNSATFFFTRIGYRKDYHNQHLPAKEVTFDVRHAIDTFRGIIKSRWSANDVLELRSIEDINNQTVPGRIAETDSDRTAIQFHVKGATDGCLMSVGKDNFIGTVGGFTIPENYPSSSKESQRSFMDIIQKFLSTDANNKKGDEIYATFEQLY